ncbi:hypothetical protein CL654_02590 [bacterium]|nr:hypothetical protein [bacterium]|tara:strand:- start:12965 stop:13414 length:450 start_codon:yes stop_codon:yes gene_type:complete
MMFEHKNLTETQKYVLGTILIILILVGVTVLVKNQASAPGAGDTGSVSNSNSVTVESQVAGESVLVKELTLSDRLWVVVYEERDGDKGNILGARRLQEGSHNDQIVTLLRGTEAGNRYYVLLHNDDGDDIFDFTKDLPLENISYTFFAR